MRVYFMDTDAYEFKPKLKAKIRRKLRGYDKNLRQIFPQMPKHVHVIIRPAPMEEVIPEYGMTAAALGTYSLYMAIAPEFKKGVDWIVENHLKSSVYHELHHLIREQHQPWGNTLLSDAISEGLATVFERDTAKADPLYADYSNVPVRDWLKDVLRHGDKEYEHEKWSFIHPDGRRWIRYRVGTYIVDQAIENNPSETAATLVDKPAKEILRMSGLR